MQVVRSVEVADFDAALLDRTRPDRVIADKGDSSRGNRAMLTERGIKVTIPERSDQLANRQRRGSAGGRPYTLDREVYEGRNVIERCFSWVKHWRAIATRYDKKHATTSAHSPWPRSCSGYIDDDSPDRT